MKAAAHMAFSKEPVQPLAAGTLELAQAGGAKITTIESSPAKEVASFATPMTEAVMKELVCDKFVLDIMKKRCTPDDFKEFESKIKGKCEGERLFCSLRRVY